MPHARIRLTSSATLLVGLVCLIAGAAAHASDGVIEISQACAVNTGCGGGDTPGFPVYIFSPGSYRLTSNLVVPDSTIDAITVSAPNVTIDLGGFQIVRAGCEMATVNCTPAFSYGSGVHVSSTTVHHVSVRNGSVIGMGKGVWLGNQAEAVDLHVRWNSAEGIEISGPSARVSGNVAYQNAATGISAAGFAVISGNRAEDNGLFGIQAGGSSVVTGNTAARNTNDGFAVGDGSTVVDNASFENGSDGIDVESGSTVYGNSCSDNGQDGIDAGQGSTVHGNTVNGNLNYGLRLTTGASYRENTIMNNSLGTVLGGLNLGSNACNNTTVCP